LDHFVGVSTARIRARKGASWSSSIHIRITSTPARSPVTRDDCTGDVTDASRKRHREAHGTASEILTPFGDGSVTIR
jgi:hypothetical protein